MINAVGRDIPEEILKATGKEVFQGNNYKDGVRFTKVGPTITPVMRNEIQILQECIWSACKGSADC